MPFMESEKNAMLQATTINRVSLHHADPGTTGADEISDSVPEGTEYERQTVAWNAAASAQKKNDGPVQFKLKGGAGNNSKVAWVGFWEHGEGFRAKAQVTEETFGSDGTYTFADDEGLVLKINDPA